MKNVSELIWELGLGLVAFAGIFTLTRDLLPNIPFYVYSIFYCLAFSFMFVSWIWRVWETNHPTSIIFAELFINSMQSQKAQHPGKIIAPSMHLCVGIMSKCDVLIQKSMYLYLDKALWQELSSLVDFDPVFKLETPDTGTFIRCPSGSYIAGTAIIPLDISSKYSDNKLENIALGGRVKLRWSVVGRKSYSTKLKCSMVYIPNGKYFQ